MRYKMQLNIPSSQRKQRLSVRSYGQALKQDTPEASIQNYIVKQAKKNGRFFEWLFDDDALSDVPLDKLDHTRLKEGLRFFHSFDL